MLREIHYLKHNIFFFILFLFLATSTKLPYADVWQANKQWNLKWEEKYAAWIVNDVTTNFLEAIQLKVDCADLCYVVRATFSRIHHLPFLAHDYKGASLSHANNSFNNLPTHSEWQYDKRFRAFLNALVNHVSTASFKYDTYPDVTLLHLFITAHQDWITPNAYDRPAKRWGLEWNEKKQKWLFNGQHTYEKVREWYIYAKDKQDVFQHSLRETNEAQQLR